MKRFFVKVFYNVFFKNLKMLFNYETKLLLIILMVDIFIKLVTTLFSFDFNNFLSFKMTDRFVYC